MLLYEAAPDRGRRPDRSGGALLIALVTVVVATLFTTSILQLSSVTSTRQSREVDNLHAFYLAEAGLAEAFEAVRVGRRGQIGSIDEPARYGNGFLWVDATPTPDNQLRLEATALVGRGHATLALIVEPVEVELGIFSDEDLIVQTTLLVDAFDPEVTIPTGGPGSITVDPSYPFLYADSEHSLLFYEGTFYHYTSSDGNTYQFDHSITVAELAQTEEFGKDSSYDIQKDDFTDDLLGAEGGDDDDDDDWFTPPPFSDQDEAQQALANLPPSADFLDVEYAGVQAYFKTVFAEGLPTLGSSSGGWADMDGYGYGGLDVLSSGADPGAGTGWSSGPVTEISSSKAIFGSNGDITIGGTGDQVQINGDAVPGVGGQVVLGTGGAVSGETEPRSTPIELPPVEVPTVALAGAVSHDSALPLVLSPGTSGFEGLAVAEDAELILRGPATVVVGDLTLAPGAVLTLDTTDGDVELFVTGSLALATGSTVLTSGTPDQLSVQISADDSLSASPAVELRATSQFYGTIYAPDAEVVVGSDFELWGSLAARVLDLEPGAKLHYADVGEKMPTLVSWKIVEAPAQVRQDAAGVLRTLTVPRDELEALADAHDLGGIQLDVTYVDVTGATKTYVGAEKDFDWDLAKEVVSTERTGWDDWEHGDHNNWWDDWGSNWWDAWGASWWDSWGSNWGSSSWDCSSSGSSGSWGSGSWSASSWGG